VAVTGCQTGARLHFNTDHRIPDSVTVHLINLPPGMTLWLPNYLYGGGKRYAAPAASISSRY
jgi:hypothetical protein